MCIRDRLYHGAVIQNGNVAANVFHHAHLVGNDNHRNAHFAVDLLNQLQNGMGDVYKRQFQRICRSPAFLVLALILCAAVIAVGVALAPAAPKVWIEMCIRDRPRKCAWYTRMLPQGFCRC